MLLHNKLQKDYTLNQSGYQLKLPLKLETIIPKNDSVRLLSQFVEEMDLTDLYSTYDRINSLSPRTLLKIVLYSYMNGDYSFRSMELNCKRDINFMFLCGRHSAPVSETGPPRRKRPGTFSTRYPDGPPAWVPAAGSTEGFPRRY